MRARGVTVDSCSLRSRAHSGCYIHVHNYTKAVIRYPVIFTMNAERAEQPRSVSNICRCKASLISLVYDFF